MRIGVTADTHSLDVPKKLLEDFKDVDLIIHAGDFCSEQDLAIFQKLSTVKAVAGNMDDARLQKLLPQRQIFKCEGFNIGLCHSYGAPKDALKNAQKEFKTNKVDIVIFGHSHNPVKEVINNVLYFNPGSPNDTICAPYCSYGVIELKDGKIVAQIKKVDI